MDLFQCWGEFYSYTILHTLQLNKFKNSPQFSKKILTKSKSIKICYISPCIYMSLEEILRYFLYIKVRDTLISTWNAKLFVKGNK